MSLTKVGNPGFGEGSKCLARFRCLCWRIRLCCLLWDGMRSRPTPFTSSHYLLRDRSLHAHFFTDFTDGSLFGPKVRFLKLVAHRPLTDGLGCEICRHGPHRSGRGMRYAAVCSFTHLPTVGRWRLGGREQMVSRPSCS